MPFSPWIATNKPFDSHKWEASVVDHDRWIARLSELAPATVLGSRTVTHRHNEGFVWDSQGYRAVHDKYYLPEEEGFWEATWYERGELDFTAVETTSIKAGFAICSEIWFTEHARHYAQQGIHILACPRATELATRDKWIAGGRAGAIMSGAFCVSSNKGGEGSGIRWGGSGWIIDPDGEVLGLTSKDEPFLTLELDLELAERAKTTYPRYVHD